jgi:hypothetical protein
MDAVLCYSHLREITQIAVRLSRSKGRSAIAVPAMETVANQYVCCDFQQICRPEI